MHRWGGSAPDSFQRVFGWCENTGYRVDGRPGARFLN